MRLMMKTPKLNERALAEWLRKSLIIRHLYIIGGGNFLTSHSHLFDRKSRNILYLGTSKTALLCLIWGTVTLFLASSCEKSLDASVRDEGHPVLFTIMAKAMILRPQSAGICSFFI